MKMTPYEREALEKIKAWQAEPPGPAARWFAKAAGPATQAVQTMVPVAALRGALAGLNTAAGKLSSRKSMLKRAGVKQLDDLEDIGLPASDKLAAGERKRAMAMGGVSGAVLGVAGVTGLVVDVPTLLVLALRTIHRTGLCYGEDSVRREGQPLTIGVFALASANSVEEKTGALEALRRHRLDSETLDAAWRDGVERAAERELAKEAAMFSLNNLARSVSLNLGWRKAAGVAPVIGALVGGSVNAWYLYDVARAAQFTFQERWLARRHPRIKRTLAALPAPVSA